MKFKSRKSFCDHFLLSIIAILHPIVLEGAVYYLLVIYNFQVIDYVQFSKRSHEIISHRK